MVVRVTTLHQFCMLCLVWLLVLIGVLVVSICCVLLLALLIDVFIASVCCAWSGC